MMFPQSRRSGSSPLPQQLKFTTSDSCDRIKDEFELLQAQYHSLKLECDKLASETSEMQRHYVMHYEMSYGLNVEMHRQAEIVKGLHGMCLGSHQTAKQGTAPERNSVIRQQLQAHQLPRLQALALPVTPCLWGCGLLLCLRSARAPASSLCRRWAPRPTSPRKTNMGMTVTPPRRTTARSRI
ncbi:unnamed protein product, partial [Rangifer tarandus platyrhynchus]